ncbi:MAG: BrnT family toxin [Bryobacteraceae bacterium]
MNPFSRISGDSPVDLSPNSIDNSGVAAVGGLSTPLIRLQCIRGFDARRSSPLHSSQIVYTIVLTSMQFEWDEHKQRAKTAKHGIEFATAALVFADPHLVLREDRTGESGEQRWHAIGLAGGLQPLLIVIHVYREENNGEEIVRIISAGKASTREGRAYFQ